MPGIVGFITKMPRDSAEPQLRRMVEAINHEPFYSTGTWIEESLGVYVGWAVQKNSFSDGQPLINERQDVVLVFSGEEYPEPGTAARLKGRLRAWDSVAVSRWAGVAESRCALLGYFCLQLPSMQAAPHP